jgi:hypothetical protein
MKPLFGSSGLASGINGGFGPFSSPANWLNQFAPLPTSEGHPPVSPTSEFLAYIAKTNPESYCDQFLCWDFLLVVRGTSRPMFVTSRTLS